GYSGNASDTKVQTLVNMLMNGVTPTDQDLIGLGIIPASQAATTPPTYVVQGGGSAPIDPTLNLQPSGVQPAPVQPAPVQPAFPTPAPAGTSGGLNLPQLPGT
ncbi:hypothetical protein BgiBS90_013783, partial [Biomphalaria glabrata]